MLPEVEEFFKNRTDSDQYYRDQQAMYEKYPVPTWNRDWNAEERAAYYAAEEARSAAVLKFTHERKEKSVLALEALKNSDNKMIAWLVTDRIINRDYDSYRDAVLRALPMDREQIDTFGDRQGWCNDYARMLDRAERAGVLPEPTPELANIDALVADFVNYYGGSDRRFRATVRKHLPAILESAKQYEAEAKLKAAAEAAKAETDTNTDTGTTGNTKSDTAPTGRTRTADGRFATASVTVAA